MSARWGLVEMGMKMRTTSRALLPAALLFACIGASAQVDRGKIEPLFRDLQSSDSGTRQKAFAAIQQNAEYLKDPETADRLLALLVIEQQAIKQGIAAGEDVEGGIYDSLLDTLSGLWKDKLTPQAFRIFATAIFDPSSGWAKGLGRHAGRFVSTLLPLANDTDEYVRARAVALMGYALAADYAGVQPLSSTDRSALRSVISGASTDKSPGVRFAVVNALSLERDAWAIPVLERMYEREPASWENIRVQMKAAVQAVRSRGQIPSQDFDALQAIYRDLQSNDPEAKSQALNALVKREDFLSFVDTPDSLLRVLDLETSAIRSRAAPEEGSSARGNAFYETLLTTTWSLWKDRLTFPTFRILAVSVYGADSAFAKELGARAGPFTGMLWTPVSEGIPPQVRDNGLALLAYMLAGVEAGAVQITPDMRKLAAKDMARAAEDRDPTIRLAVVNAAKLAGGAWAVPILEQMYEREASFDPSGKNRQSTEAFRGNVKAAIQSIQSRTGK